MSHLIYYDWDNRRGNQVSKEMAVPAAGLAQQERELTPLERYLDGRLRLFAYWRQLAYLFMEFWIGLRALRGNQRRYVKNLTIHQIIFSGIDAVGVVSIIAVVIGGVVLVQMMTFAPGFQSSPFLMGIVSSLLTKEMAPVFTALILVGRSGSAITVELGTMRVKRHHEALAAMGIDIAQYFYVPRVIGLTVAGILLNGYFAIMTFFSWFIISSFQRGIDMQRMMNLFVDSLHASDLFISVLKGGVLGMAVAIICIHQGSNVKKSVTEIPQRTSKAIVTAFISTFIINMVISLVWYMMQ